jgi:Fe-S cluster biogenesis protein NfuA
MAQDDLLSHLLLLHGLHPVTLEERVAKALDEVRPSLQAHGGDVEFLGFAGSSVRLRLAGSCRGCPSSTVTLRTTVEEALRKAAPELEAIEVDGVPVTHP